MERFFIENSFNELECWKDKCGINVSVTSVEFAFITLNLTQAEELKNFLDNLIRKETSKTSDAAKSVDVDKRGS